MTCVDREIELALVARLRDGDPSAFGVVHERYNRPLFNFLGRLTRRRDVAEDLLEETWFRLVAHAGGLDSDTRLGPWLFTVARNLHVSYCRSRAIDDKRAAGAIGLWPVIAPGDSPFDHAAGNELQRRIETALGALPIAAREVLLLVGVEGLRPVEAAKVCGISAEALRQRLKRARADLACRLARLSDSCPETKP